MSTVKAVTYSPWQVFKRLMSLGRAYVFWYAALVAATVVSSGLEVGWTEANRRMVNGATQGSISLLKNGLIFSIGVLVVSVTLNILTTYFGGLLDHVSVMNLQSMIVKKISRIRMSDFQRYHTGDLIARINDSAGQAQVALNSKTRQMFHQILSVVFLLIYLGYLNLTLTISILVISVLLPMLINPLSKPIRKLYDERQKLYAKKDSFIQDSVHGAEIVRTFSLSERLTKKFWGIYDIILGYTRKTLFLEHLIGQSNFVVVIGGIIFVLGYGGVLVSRGDLDVGGLVAFLFSFERVANPLAGLARTWPEFQRSVSQANRVFEIMDLDEEPIADTADQDKAQTEFIEAIDGKKSGDRISKQTQKSMPVDDTNRSGTKTSNATASRVKLKLSNKPMPNNTKSNISNSHKYGLQQNGDIRFDDVYFTYTVSDGDDGSEKTDGADTAVRDDGKKRIVLNGISFSADAGKVTALVGSSGSGKSTILKLLLRFYSPTNGEIRYGGKAVGTLPLDEWRDMIAYVSQDPVLFSGTLYDNIAYGRPGSSQQQVYAAAEAANIHDFIMSCEDGYDTMIGERGIRLSGGQRQRIALARAVLRDPEILVLDEPTSSLDSESELAVQKALADLMKERTTIVVAHRLSTIRDADKILFLGGGVVKEEGTHEQLMAMKGGYFIMHEATKETGDQSKNEKDFEDSSKEASA